MNKLRRMVSGDTRILRLWGKPRFSHPEICSGDQFRISLRATIVRSSLRRASKHGLGRRADFQAWWSALLARYRGRPPWRATSRLTVEAARCKFLAISRIDDPEAMPREISSRSASVRVRSERDEQLEQSRRAAITRNESSHGLCRGTADLMQRFSRLPTTPYLGLLRCRKT